MIFRVELLLFQINTSKAPATSKKSCLNSHALSTVAIWVSFALLCKRLADSDLLVAFYSTEEQIYELFSRCGDIRRIVMGLDKFKKTPCGFCFVEYYLREDSEACMRYINGTRLDDRIVRLVDFVKLPVRLLQCFFRFQSRLGCRLHRGSSVWTWQVRRPGPR